MTRGFFRGCLVALVGALAPLAVPVLSFADDGRWSVREVVDVMDGSVSHRVSGPFTRPDLSLSSADIGLGASVSFSCRPSGSLGKFGFWFSEDLILAGGGSFYAMWENLLRIRLGDGEVREVEMYQSDIGSRSLFSLDAWEGPEAWVSEAIARGGEVLLELLLYDGPLVYFRFDLSGLPDAVAETPCSLDL